MKLFNLQLIIPTGERAVVFKAPLKCESLGIILTTDLHANYDAEQRLGLYKQLLDSLGHLYHSAKAMTPEVAERMLSVVEEIKAIDAPLLLEHGWEANFASTDQQLEFKFMVTEVDEHGVPIDADEPNGSIEMSYAFEGESRSSRTLIKKHMTVEARGEIYDRLFEGLQTEDESELNEWLGHLKSVIARDDYLILAMDGWQREFTSTGRKVTIKYMGNRVEELPDGE